MASVETSETRSMARLAAPMGIVAVAGAVLCAALWGANSVAVKVAQQSFPPWMMAGIRFGTSALLIGSWARLNGYSLGLTKAQVLMALVNGLLLYLQIGGFTVGTTQSTSLHSVLLINVYPFMTALIGWLFMGDGPIAGRKLLGLAVAFVGVAVTLGEDIIRADPRIEEGDLLLLVSSIILGIKVSYVKAILGKITIFALVFWEAAVAVSLFLTTSFLFEQGAIPPVRPEAIVGVLYQGAIVSTIGFLIWTSLLSRHGANELASYSFLTPAFGLVFGPMLLGERASAYLLAGGALIIFGIYLVNVPPRLLNAPRSRP